MIYDCFWPEIKILNICMVGISSLSGPIPMGHQDKGIPSFWCHRDSPIVWGIPPLYEGFPISLSPSHCSPCRRGASLTGAPSLGADVLSLSPLWIELTEAPSLSAVSPRLPDPHGYQSPEVKEIRNLSPRIIYEGSQFIPEVPSFLRVELKSRLILNIIFLHLIFLWHM